MKFCKQYWSGLKIGDTNHPMYFKHETILYRKLGALKNGWQCESSMNQESITGIIKFGACHHSCCSEIRYLGWGSHFPCHHWNFLETHKGVNQVLSLAIISPHLFFDTHVFTSLLVSWNSNGKIVSVFLFVFQNFCECVNWKDLFCIQNYCCKRVWKMYFKTF